MPCNIEVLKRVPLFALLDDDEAAVLAGQVELKTYAARQRIYKMGDHGGRGYLLVDGSVRISSVDQDEQEVVVDEPAPGGFFGFASMLEDTPHQTEALALEESVCVEVDRKDIAVLLERKPMAGMDMLAVLGHQFHGAHELARSRSTRPPNEIIEEKSTWGEHIADLVAHFGGSWAFIISFLVVMIIYVVIQIAMRAAAWDPYPYILLNLFLSLLAAIQAPVIMMSQNRQDKKDRLRSELDYDVNRRAAADIQGLSRKLNLLGAQIGDVEERLRETPRPDAPQS